MKNNITASLIIASGLAWLGSGCAASNTLAKQQALLPKEKIDAPGLFAENCATCHGKDGRARTFHGRVTRAQNFTDAGWQATNEDIIHAIKIGPKVMPAFEEKLSGAEIEALAAYVSTFKSIR